MEIILFRFPQIENIRLDRCEEVPGGGVAAVRRCG
jgi:hypothetical protein